MKHLVKYVLGLGLLLSSGLSQAASLKGNYKLIPAHSSIHFKVLHENIALVVGRFNDFSGTFVLNPEGESHANFEVKVASVDTGNEKRDRHLRGRDFFDANIHTTMKFKTIEVLFNRSEEPVEIKGELTLLGTTKQVTLQVLKIGQGKDQFGDEMVGFQANGKISRSEFGMDKFADVVGDEVSFEIQIEGQKL